MLVSVTDLPPKKVYIGIGLRLPHGFDGIKINTSCRIGDNCTLFHNITLGSLEWGKETEITIGDDVYIGTGCLILGKVSIGHGSRIGAGTRIINAVIEPDTTVVTDLRYRVIKR